MQEQLRIGSRASALALAQAEMVKSTLLDVAPHLTISIHPMTTRGDSDTALPLSSWGYKGLFTKELEDALLERRIDLAVHSMKDMPSILPDALMIAAMLPREDVRDAWISRIYPTMHALPAGAVIGTASLRRSAQIRLNFPHVTIVPLRGNVQTRLGKLARGDAEATFLACAGLKRLGAADHIAEMIAVETMLPAVAQGAIGIETRSDASELNALLARINHAATFHAVACERAMLRELDGSCRTPIAGYATIADDRITLRAQVIAPDGSADQKRLESASLTDGEALGAALGRSLRASVPHHWLIEV